MSNAHQEDGFCMAMSEILILAESVIAEIVLQSLK
jgi:hypothetical protein